MAAYPALLINAVARHALIAVQVNQQDASKLLDFEGEEILGLWDK
jgi:hypothetical protein